MWSLSLIVDCICTVYAFLLFEVLLPQSSVQRLRLKIRVYEGGCDIINNVLFRVLTWLCVYFDVISLTLLIIISPWKYVFWKGDIFVIIFCHCFPWNLSIYQWESTRFNRSRWSLKLTTCWCEHKHIFTLLPIYVWCPTC